MAIRDETISKNLLAYAKKEFLEKGFEKASLRDIAEKAGCTKGAIYIRYSDKTSLFNDIVMPYVDELCEKLKDLLDDFNSLSSESKKNEMNKASDNGIKEFVSYIYAHFDEFKLLMTCGENTSSRNFIHRLVEIDTESTIKFIESTGNDAFTSGRLTKDFLHLLSNAFYTGFFEIVIHDMPENEAQDHIKRLRSFYNAGWKTIL